jgi:hypothetical protein
MRPRGAFFAALLVALGACTGAVEPPDGDADADSDLDADLDADGDTDLGFEFERYGELTIRESGDQQIMDEADVMFRTRRSLEVDARCGYDYYDDFYGLVPMGECRVMEEFDDFPTDCYSTSCEYCVPTDDCGGWRCADDDPAVLLEAGEIAIAGGAEPCSCTLRPGELLYSCSSPDPWWMLFEPGQALEVSAPGSTFPGFELTLDVLQRPEVTSEWTIDSFDGTEDVHVMWVPSGWDCRIDVMVQSGPSLPRFLWCVTDDDGELVIPAATIAEIAGPLAAGVAVDVTRINEVTIQPTADSVLTARSMNSARVDVMR